MRKLAISIAITSALGLTACDDTTLEDVQVSVETEKQELAVQAAQTRAEEAAPRLRVLWDPANVNFAFPNDLVFSGTQDFTLSTESPNSEGVVDYTDPTNALGALDGWGTQNPFSVTIETDDPSVMLDATSVNAMSVHLYEIRTFPDFRDPECLDTTNPTFICKGENKLTFGVDYIAMAQGNSVVVIPLTPLKAQQSYALTFTKELKDSNGREVLPSSTYNSVQLDLTTAPIVLPSLPDSELNETQAGIRQLQTLVNNYEDTLADDFDTTQDDIIYTQVFTTQSAGVKETDPLQVVKQVNADVFGQMLAADETSVATIIMPTMQEVAPEVSVNVNVSMALFGADGVAPFDKADLYSTSIKVPYYLETLETGDPMTGRWEAACDSLIIAASVSNEGADAGPYNDICGMLPETPLGKFGDYGLDTARHLTKYNPLPAQKGMDHDVPVQVTLPNANSGIDKPAAGWPVVILQHGITSRKEDMLAVTGALAAAGFASVAIDHPLHGERSIEIPNADGTGSGTFISASSAKHTTGDNAGADIYPGNDPTVYLNLASLLTARDNLRQSAADGLKLRLALNAFIDGTDGSAAIDPSNVYYMGHSLGAITGTNMVAVANTDTGNEDLNALYHIKGAVLANPGSSIANFLVESGSFGPLVQTLVIYGLENELTAAAQTYLPGCGFDGTAAPTTEQLVCSFTMLSAEEAYQPGIQAAMAQFAFAAQAVIEAGDPSNYARQFKENNTPVLMFEITGDGTDDNKPDQVIPNYTSTDAGIAFGAGLTGSTGLANQLELQSITETLPMGMDSVSGIVRFNSGSHSTILTPDDDGDGNYPLNFGVINQEMQNMMATFFATGTKSIPVADGIATGGLCVIVGGTTANCSN